MDLRFLIFMVFLFLTLTLFSQNKVFLDGYIVKTSGDTIFGKLAVLPEIESCKRIELQGSDEKFKSRKRKVKAYKRGSDYFETKSYNVKGNISTFTHYMKVIENGKVKLYEVNGKYAAADYTWTGSIYFVEKHGLFQKVKSNRFHKKMSTYFFDNKELSDKILNKELTYSDIEKIVSIYNQEE